MTYFELGHEHKFVSTPVVQLGDKPGSQQINHPVCRECGYDDIDKVYRCVQPGCHKILNQWESDGVQMKCSIHREQVPENPARL